MITFQEDSSPDYKSRTFKNASADATIAIAINFNTAGERCTKNAVLKQNKIYIPVNFTQDTIDMYSKAKDIVEIFNDNNVKTLNIAGNGLYTLKNMTLQYVLDEMVFKFLGFIINDKNLKNKIELIRSGGQTGIDEAGIKAAVKLNIPALVLAPKGWKFRSGSGTNYSNEFQFKQRFEDA